MISREKPHIFKSKRSGTWLVIPIRYQQLSQFDWIVLAIGFGLFPKKFDWKIDREFWNIKAEWFAERLNQK